MIEKISETEWKIEAIRPGDEFNYSIYIPVEVTSEGIEIEYHLITWEELEKVKSVLSTKKGEDMRLTINVKEKQLLTNRILIYIYELGQCREFLELLATDYPATVISVASSAPEGHPIAEAYEKAKRLLVSDLMLRESYVGVETS